MIRHSVLAAAAVVLGIGLALALTGADRFDSSAKNVWTKVDSLTTQTADTILVDWSNTTLIPSWHNTFYLTQIGWNSAASSAAFDHAVDILVSGTTQAGSYFLDVGTQTPLRSGIGADYWPPLVFKRKNGNIKIVMSRGVTTTGDFWVRGWTDPG